MNALIRAIEAYDGGDTLLLHDVPAAPSSSDAANVHRKLTAVWHRQMRTFRTLREIRISLPRDAVWLRSIPGFLGTPDRLGEQGDGRWHLIRTSVDAELVTLHLQRSSRRPGRIGPRHGSHLLVVATASRRRFVGRTVGFVVVDGHQRAVPEHRSKRFANPITAAAHSLADALEHVAAVNPDGGVNIWTPYEALQVALLSGPATRVPQIYRALTRLSRGLEAIEIDAAVRVAKRRGSVSRRIVTRWAGLSIAQFSELEIQPFMAEALVPSGSPREG